MTNWMRTDKPMKRNGKYPIYLRIRVKNKETKVPTGLDVAKERWDDKRKEPKDKALLIQLNKKRTEIDLRVNRALADGQALTIDLIKQCCSERKILKPENQSFYDYYLDFVERKKKENLDSETIRVYKTTYNILKEFRSEILISDISLSLIENFDDYMQEVRGCRVQQQMQNYSKKLKNLHFGVSKFNFSLGLELSLYCTFLMYWSV